MRYCQIRPSVRVLTGVIRNRKCSHASPTRGGARDAEVSGEYVKIIAGYCHEIAYLVVPNYLIENKLRNTWPLFEILVVGHSVAPVLVKNNGIDKLADDRELAPVDQLWMVGFEILIPSMNTIAFRDIPVT